MDDIINREKIYSELERLSKKKDVNYNLILDKFERFNKLNDEELTILLFAPQEYNNRIFHAAEKINNAKFKNYRKFYGVSYITDFCIETCKYCGDNIYSNRKTYKKVNISDNSNNVSPKYFLSKINFKKDINSLVSKHPELEEICVLTGNNPSLTNSKLIDYLKIFKNEYNGKLILNIPPINIQDFKDIKEVFSDRKIQFRVFQETYDKKVYDREHPDFKDENGVERVRKKLREKGIFTPPKKDFDYRIYAQDRALLGNFDEVGLGVLFGLNNNTYGHEFEILSLIKHSNYLNSKFGKFPQTISFPRILPSVGVTNANYNFVTEQQLIRYLSIIKIALPTVELIITCRETAEFRSKVRPIINIEDFEARPGPGGNYKNDVEFQMEIVDRRKGEDIFREIKNQGYIIK